MYYIYKCIVCLCNISTFTSITQCTLWWPRADSHGYCLLELALVGKALDGLGTRPFIWDRATESEQAIEQNQSNGGNRTEAGQQNWGRASFRLLFLLMHYAKCYPLLASCVPCSLSFSCALFPVYPSHWTPKSHKIFVLFSSKRCQTIICQHSKRSIQLSIVSPPHCLEIWDE